MKNNPYHLSETEQQILVFEWANLMSQRYPDLAFMYHTPNGGSRNALEAKKLKRAGVRAGVPDICLPCPRGQYHGLYIEMKVGKNKPTDNQKRFLEYLHRKGYLTVICYSADEDIDIISLYLKIDSEGNDAIH